MGSGSRRPTQTPLTKLPVFSFFFEKSSGFRPGFVPLSRRFVRVSSGFRSGVQRIFQMTANHTRQLARATNNPLAGLNLSSASGRRIRDLYLGLMAKLDLDDVVIRAAVRRAVELQVLSEQQRARMFSDHDAQKEVLAQVEAKPDAGQPPSGNETPCLACQARQTRYQEHESLIRLENMVARGMREIAELIAAVPKPPESHQELIRRLHSEQTAEHHIAEEDRDEGEAEEDSAATD
jgi:hypothetical protein